MLVANSPDDTATGPPVVVLQIRHHNLWYVSLVKPLADADLEDRKSARAETAALEETAWLAEPGKPRDALSPSIR